MLKKDIKQCNKIKAKKTDWINLSFILKKKGDILADAMMIV
jgi:hypothetical protein